MVLRQYARVLWLVAFGQGDRQCLHRVVLPFHEGFRLEHLANDGSFAEGKAHRALEDARRSLIVYAAATAELRSVA